MAKRLKHEPSIPNPALAPFSILVGQWTTVGTHPLFPDFISTLDDYATGATARRGVSLRRSRRDAASARASRRAASASSASR
jgi:hypothetical protein